MRSVITKFFGQTKVDGVHQVSLFAQTHQKVVGLDVAVNEVFAMDELNPTDLQKESIFHKGLRNLLDLGLNLCPLNTVF